MFLWQCYPTVLNVEDRVGNQRGGKKVAKGSIVVN